MAFQPPVMMPVTLDIPESYGVALPLTLPVTFGVFENCGVILPITLPVTFRRKRRASLKIPCQITCKYANERRSIRFPVTETANTKQVSFPLKETSWSFCGLIMEENIVSLRSKPITMIDEVRSRILTDVALIDKNHIKITWYGDSVPVLDILTKSYTDDTYTVFKTCQWNETAAEVLINDSDYNILLQGKNGTGESLGIDVGALNSVEIKTELDIALNKKIYDISIEYISRYLVEINY